MSLGLRGMKAMMQFLKKSRAYTYLCKKIVLLQMKDNSLKRFFGSFLTILAIVVILFACVAFLSDGKPVLGMSVTKWESLVPFVVGLVFLASGVSLISQS